MELWPPRGMRPRCKAVVDCPFRAGDGYQTGAMLMLLPARELMHGIT